MAVYTLRNHRTENVIQFHFSSVLVGTLCASFVWSEWGLVHCVHLISCCFLLWHIPVRYLPLMLYGVDNKIYSESTCMLLCPSSKLDIWFSSWESIEILLHPKWRTMCCFLGLNLEKLVLIRMYFWRSKLYLVNLDACLFTLARLLEWISFLSNFFSF
jgi:hypothetical protein